MAAPDVEIDFVRQNVFFGDFRGIDGLDHLTERFIIKYMGIRD